MELKPRFKFVHCARFRLLIVPYGIETLSKQLQPNPLQLLIVPYGIETKVKVTEVNPSPSTFNRTLWN